MHIMMLLCAAREETNSSSYSSAPVLVPNRAGAGIHTERGGERDTASHEATEGEFGRMHKIY